MPIPDHLRQHHIFAGGNWGAMSGEKPMHKPIVPATHENLVRALKGMGLKFEETHGKYEQPERSVIIYNPSRQQMRHLGKMFGQDSVVHSQGGQHKLVYTNGPHEGKERGTALTGEPIEFFANPPDDYYTHLPGHGYFRVNFDWNKEPEGEPVQSGLAKAWPTEKESKANQETHRVIGDLAEERGKVIASPRPVHSKDFGINAHRAPFGGGGLSLRNTAISGDKRHYMPAISINDQELERMNELATPPNPEMRSTSERYGNADLLNSTAEPLEGTETYWQSIGAHSALPHPNAYPWHDDNLPDWDREDALARARKLKLIKADEQHLEDQNAPVGVSTYAKFAAPYGSVNPSAPSDLTHYPYHGKLPEIENLVKQHGYKTYYAGGKYGKPDLVNKNYNTGHLMIYDPTPGSGGDFKHEEYTKGWRQIHELAHALTYPELNKIYGEGRRMGKLGIHRNLNEAMRAVHWEWLAAHKQRELGEQLGIHIPDNVFHKELNTVMHDAVHRAVTGKFTEPSGEGFTPHEHKVPLSHAMDVLRDEAQNMGLQHRHQTLKPAAIAKHEKREELLAKAFPLEKRSKNVREHLAYTTEEQRIARTKAFLPKIGINVRDPEALNFQSIREAPHWVNKEGRTVSVAESKHAINSVPPALHEAGHALTAPYGRSIEQHQKDIGEVDMPISPSQKIDEGMATKMGHDLGRRAGIPPQMSDPYGTRITARSHGYDPKTIPHAKSKVPDFQRGAVRAAMRTELMDQGLAGIQNGKVMRIGTGEEGSGYFGYRSLKDIHAKINARAMGYGPKPKKP